MPEAREALAKSWGRKPPAGRKQRLPQQEMEVLESSHDRDENHRGPATTTACWRGVCWICTLAISIFLDSSRSIEEGIIKTTREKFVSLLQAFFIRIEFDGGSSTKGIPRWSKAISSMGLLETMLTMTGPFCWNICFRSSTKSGCPRWTSASKKTMHSW